MQKVGVDKLYIAECFYVGRRVYNAENPSMAHCGTCRHGFWYKDHLRKACPERDQMHSWRAVPQILLLPEYRSASADRTKLDLLKILYPIHGTMRMPRPKADVASQHYKE
jgi:hypothetical protein